MTENFEKLTPEIISKLVLPKMFCENVEYFEETSSTNDIAKAMADNGAKEGTLVIAESQAHGKGRWGRNWESPKYLGIYVSIILRPKLNKEIIPFISLISGIATAETIKEEMGLDAKIKWPNDILIREKKVSGILIESSIIRDKFEFLILGIGINVNNETFKGEYLHTPTSLRIEKDGNIISRKKILERLLVKLEKWYFLLLKEPDGKETILKRYKELSHTLGKEVTLRAGKDLLKGTAIDIDQMGFLVLKDKKGKLERIPSGELTNES